MILYISAFIIFRVIHECPLNLLRQKIQIRCMHLKICYLYSYNFKLKMVSLNIGEVESPLRCKARLERHQRTVERAVLEVHMLYIFVGQYYIGFVFIYLFSDHLFIPLQANALAEKNTRDILAQREQAERNVRSIRSGKYKIYFVPPSDL